MRQGFPRAPALQGEAQAIEMSMAFRICYCHLAKWVVWGCGSQARGGTAEPLPTLEVSRWKADSLSLPGDW